MIGLGSDTNTVETLQCDVLPAVHRRQALSRLVMDDSDALESPFKAPPSLFMCATRQLELGFDHFAHFDHFFNPNHGHYSYRRRVLLAAFAMTWNGVFESRSSEHIPGA